MESLEGAVEHLDAMAVDVLIKAVDEEEGLLWRGVHGVNTLQLIYLHVDLRGIGCPSSTCEPADGKKVGDGVEGIPLPIGIGIEALASLHIVPPQAGEDVL